MAKHKKNYFWVFCACLLVGTAQETSGFYRSPIWEAGMITSGAVTIVLTVTTLAKLAVKQDSTVCALGTGISALTYLLCLQVGNQTWSIY